MRAGEKTKEVRIRDSNLKITPLKTLLGIYNENESFNTNNYLFI